MAKKINIEQKLKSIMERVIQENCNFEDFGYIESDKIGDSILVQTSKYCDGRYFVNSGHTTLSRHIDKLLREDYEYTFDELKKEYPKKDDDEIFEMMNEIDEPSAVYFTIKLHYFTDEGKGLAELVVEESNFYSDMINEMDSVYEKWFNGLNKKDIEKALKEVCKEYNSINFSIKEGNKTNMSIKDKNIDMAKKTYNYVGDLFQMLYNKTIDEAKNLLGNDWTLKKTYDDDGGTRYFYFVSGDKKEDGEEEFLILLTGLKGKEHKNYYVFDVWTNTNEPYLVKTHELNEAETNMSIKDKNIDMEKKKSMYEVGDIVETQTTNGLVKGVVEKKLYAELNPPVWIYTIKGKLADGTPYMANSVREEDIVSSINKGFKPMKKSVAMKNVTKFKEQELDPIFKAHKEECKKMGLGTKDCNKLWEEKYKPMYEEKKAQFDKILKESWLAEGYKTTGTTEKHNMSISAKGFKFPNSNLYFHGTKHNVNGNKVLQFSFSGGRKFSIYPSAFGYYNTIYFSKGDDFNEFAKDHFGSVENFEKQIVSYIVNRGTEMQKNELYYDENKINFACGKGNFDLYSAKNSSFGRNYKLSPKDTNVWQDKEIMIQNVNDIHDLMCWRFDDDNKDKCVRFDKEGGKGGTEYILSQEYFWEKVGDYKFGYNKFKDEFYIEQDGNRLFDVALKNGRYQFIPKSQSIYEEHFDKVRRDFAKWAKTARWERLVLPKRKDVVELIKKICIQQNFSIIDDTKDVLRAGGKLAGNIVKDTLYNGGILMF